MALQLQKGRENPILRKISTTVKALTPAQKKLIKQMIAEVKSDKNAVGLAAPQVGVNIRIVVVYIEPRIFAMINPVITEFSEETNFDEEGCLSLPGKFGKVERSTYISVEFLDDKFRKKKLHLSHFDARLVQHEVDHLDGILFVDRMKEEHLKEMYNIKKEY